MNGCRVLGFIPSSSAAPPGPRTFPFAIFNTRRKLSGMDADSTDGIIYRGKVETVKSFCRNILPSVFASHTVRQQEDTWTLNIPGKPSKKHREPVYFSFKRSSTAFNTISNSSRVSSFSRQEKATRRSVLPKAISPTPYLSRRWTLRGSASTAFSFRHMK